MSPRAALALLLLSALAAVLLARPGAPPAPRSLTARVERVVDGDTIVVRLAGGRRETVRYIGVDTPESVKPGVPVQCFAKAAGRENARLVARRVVRLVPGAEPRDRYGRLLAYVHRGTVLINARLVAGGFARTLAIPPNTAYAKRFTVLQNRARRAGRGLWRRC